MIASLAGSAMTLVVLAGTARADIDFIRGTVEPVPPQPALGLNAFQSDSLARVMAESQNVVLPQSLTVDATEPGTYTSFAGLAGTIPAGTHVDSYILHEDTLSVTTTFSGSLEFDSRVLGLITLDSRQLASDPIVGLPGTQYAASAREWDFEAGDSIRLSNDRYVVDFTDTSPVGQQDQLRVITAGLPDCFGLPATIVGTLGRDVIRGTPGNDVIFAKRGFDRIKGLGGDDLICAGGGHDRVFAGTGEDRVTGERGRDFVRGQGGDDVLLAERGRDRLFGDGGRDRLVGGSGRDRLYGGPGPDRLFGGNGKDQLFGGAGKDRLSGGTGRDKIRQ